MKLYTVIIVGTQLLHTQHAMLQIHNVINGGVPSHASIPNHVSNVMNDHDFVEKE